MDEGVSFGYWLRRRRKALDLTQAELARRVGCSVVTIRKMEADEQRPSKQLAAVLADRLEVPPDERATFIHFARMGIDTAPPSVPLPAVAALLPPRVDDRPIALPVPLSSLIGRQREVSAAIGRLNEGTVRLLTLT